MVTSRSRPRLSTIDHAAIVLCGVTWILLGLLVAPVWMALAAGIASISVVVFGCLALLLASTGPFVSNQVRLLIGVAFIASLIGLVVPQAALSRTATRHDASLRFDLSEYLHFSGETDNSTVRHLFYKQTAQTRLDIAFYRSVAAGERPLVVLLHGGAWRYGSHLETGDWPRLLTQHGYHVASIEYRLSAGQYPTWQDAPQDVHDALSYLRDKADTLDIDTSRLHLLGQSAGGHLALLEAYRTGDVASVTALYAPIDLKLDYETSRDKAAELDFIGGPPAQYAARYHAVSPLTYVGTESPRTLLVQGTYDDLVDTKNTQLLQAALRQHGASVSTLLLPLTGHSFENQRGGFATQITEQRVLRFLSH